MMLHYFLKNFNIKNAEKFTQTSNHQSSGFHSIILKFNLADHFNSTIIYRKDHVTLRIFDHGI